MYYHLRWRKADIEVPNLLVDVNFWEKSACYPYNTFYLLNDDHSTWHHWIIKADFRPYLTSGSYNQAPFCLYSQRLKSI